jgi:hypothetical protein
MNKQKLIIIILGVLLVILGVSFFLYAQGNRSNSINVSDDDYTMVPDLEVLTETEIIPDNNEDVRVSNNSDLKTQSSPMSQPQENYLVYTTKAGIQIPYPEEYNFFLKEPSQWWPEIEEIQFGFKDNVENIMITPSSSKYYDAGSCSKFTNGVQYKTVSVGSFVLYEYQNSLTSEVFCLATPEYVFQLNRDLSNSVKIDVSKIIFP